MKHLKPLISSLMHFLGKYGFEMLKTLIKAGKDVVDLSFMPENVLELQSLAKENGVTVISDFGVAPGTCGALLGYEAAKMQKVEIMRILVGGLPLSPQPPYYYKAPFEPMGVIAEYTRPTRFKEFGELVTKEPLTDPERFFTPHVDTHLTAFNTDGCRTLLDSFPNVPNIVEKTIRNIEHYEFIKDLKDGGFFDEEHIENTAKVVLPHWKLEEGEKEFTVMQVKIIGDSKVVTWDMYDEWTNGVPSMARTTGYAASAAANLILSGNMEKGIITPEALGAKAENMEFVLRYLKERGVVYKCTIS